MDGALVDCRLVEENRQQQVQRLCGSVMVVIPPIAKCAMDGAPVDRWLVKENRQQQVQWLCGWVMVVIPPIAKCAMDGAPVDCRLGEENRQRQVQRRWLGEGCGGEADFSAPLLANARAASVEMTMLDAYRCLEMTMLRMTMLERK